MSASVFGSRLGIVRPGGAVLASRRVVTIQGCVAYRGGMARCTESGSTTILATCRFRWNRTPLRLYVARRSSRQCANWVRLRSRRHQSPTCHLPDPT